ncbi:hypothetical protein ASD02_01645 [Ensifer sp. Root1252]|nr:hypothetical protein ASD02_01645 [Ensifer sp. Root1252]KRC83672.1 hypothetical protein ASE32_01635 [Ensifer sp. Root231]KRD04025.1 hypothetical protein ASE47_00295 [Ensifer sp. Root258]
MAVYREALMRRNKERSAWCQNSFDFPRCNPRPFEMLEDRVRNEAIKLSGPLFWQSVQVADHVDINA